MKIKKRKIMIVLLLGILILNSTVVLAEEDSDTLDMEEEWMDKFLDYSDEKEINAFLDEIFPEDKIRFSDIVKMLIDPEKTVSSEKIFAFFSDILFSAIQKNKTAILFLLVMSLVAALLANFTDVFQSKQVASIGFYIVYLLMITISLKAFQLTVTEVETSMEQLLTFMKIFSPVYFVGMSITVGSVSSIAFYNIVIFLIYIVEVIIFRILLPFVHIYLIMQVLNFLSEEDMLSKFSELIKVFVEWTLKFLFACVSGISLVEGLLTPAIDTVKRNAITKGIEMLPGIGDIAGGTGEILLGTAVLVKNGIGVAGAVIIFCICMIPVLNIFVVMILYKCVAAFIQPISEKRFVEAISSIGNGYQLLLKIEVTTAILFFITVGVAVKVSS